MQVECETFLKNQYLKNVKQIMIKFKKIILFYKMLFNFIFNKLLKKNYLKILQLYLFLFLN